MRNCIDQTRFANKTKSFLEANLPRYLNILRCMIGINSFTMNAEGVNRLGHYTAGVFRDLGFEEERVPSVNPLCGNHLVLVRKGSGSSSVGYVSHLDTVFPAEEEERNDFRWREHEDRIYGPGTVDIKGGTVMILMMLEALRHVEPELFESVTWVVLLDASEETESVDFGDLCKKRLGTNALACLIFEAGKISGNDMNIVTSRKGRAEIKISVEGKGAHSGVAHRKGASAILQLAHLIEKIESITDYTKDLTVNVGRIAGGSQINRVPHYAEAYAEMRAFSPDVFEKGLSDILSLNTFSSVSSLDGTFKCMSKVELIRRVPAWPDNPASSRIFSLWQTAGRELGINVRVEKRGGLSDGNYFWDCIPTIDGLGPSGGNPHCSEHSSDGSKEQEYVDTSSFVPKTLLNVLALMELIEKSN